MGLAKEFFRYEYAESLNERTLRMKYLDTILTNAERVLLYGNKGDAEIFKEFLRDRNDTVGIEFVQTDAPIRVNSKDAFFVLVRNAEPFVNIYHSLTRQGVKAWQIFSPVCFFFPLLAEKFGFINMPKLEDFQLPVLATIDTVNACNLDCATCGKPRWQENGERMSFDLFQKCLDKLQIMGIKAVELYNYTEPFLNSNMLHFMAEVKKRGLSLGLSSNLSLPHIPNLKECVDLLEDGDWFMITISGMSQDIYEINHRRGKIENVIENIKVISQSANSRRVTLRLLKFDYNLGEMPAARRLADKYNLGFQWFQATGSPFDGEEKRIRKERRLRHGIGYNDYDKTWASGGFTCPFIQSRNIVINHKGNVELCCVDVTRPWDLGSFLDQDISVLQMKRTFHPLCHSCTLIDDCPDDYNNLRKFTPINPFKVSNVLKHAMDTICME